MFRKILITALVGMFALGAQAQTPEFTYQGKLNDGGIAANGNYDFEFLLFDALSGGGQIGATIPKNNTPITGGVFNVKLDFGSVFPGANRYLEIRVRLTGVPGFTILEPRQLMNSAPYSIKSLSTDNAATANNASNLGGAAANLFVQTTDVRLADARNPLPNSTNYIQNTASPQTASNFNISGNGTAGGTLTGSTVNAMTQLNIGGNRFISGGTCTPSTTVTEGDLNPVAFLSSECRQE